MAEEGDEDRNRTGEEQTRSMGEEVRFQVVASVFLGNGKIVLLSAAKGQPDSTRNIGS